VSNILTIAYTTEGSTDQRFLKSIIVKVFDEVAFGCEGSIEVFDPVFIKLPKNGDFVSNLVEVSAEAYKIGINVLCVHVDADSNSDEQVTQFKITPAFKAINIQADNTSCKNLVAIIPIHMTEAWMLADKDLLKDEIGTDMSNTDLGINRAPESIADPKKNIESALNIAQAHLPKRRKKIYIEDLYQPIGQKIAIEKLEMLSSFNQFKLAVENALRELNYLN
jgi:hypothetical protein